MCQGRLPENELEYPQLVASRYLQVTGGISHDTPCALIHSSIQSSLHQHT